jgi:hypothetical protein
MKYMMPEEGKEIETLRGILDRCKRVELQIGDKRDFGNRGIFVIVKKEITHYDLRKLDRSTRRQLRSGLWSLHYKYDEYLDEIADRFDLPFEVVKREVAEACLEKAKKL